ncbi:MAG TPA: sulfatase-like hydrolase/transferase, partial [Chthoniobacterales bacterium]|nr:sulfatase-like hydrolase/transferase [Chthoniobacterales bacterium]
MSFFRCLAVCLILATGVFGQSPPPASSGPLNFLIILVDDLGAGDLECYGNIDNKTPNIDRLAVEGTRFELCYATPNCTPSRVMLLTGQYGFRTGWFSLIGRPYSPRPDSPEFDIGKKFTFAKLLKARGYATSLSGKWQLPGELPDLIRECGFDEYRMWAYRHNLPPGANYTDLSQAKNPDKTSRYWQPCIVENGQFVATGPNDYGPDMFNQFTIDFIQRNKDKPFCAYYPSVLAHRPHVETPDPADPGKRIPGSFKSNLEYLDSLVGKMMATLDDLKLTQRTVVIFLGDNTAGDGKGQLSETGAHVPLIIRCPGTVKSGVVSPSLTDISDIVPTIGEFAQAALPKDQTFDGKSLVPLLRGETSKHREWIFSYLGPGRLVRDNRWLLQIDKKGKETFLDCDDRRDGRGYKDMTGSWNREANAARRRLKKILDGLPGPDDRPGMIKPG